MKLKQIAALITSLAFVTLASAQANSFAGFSLGLNADMMTTSSELSAGGVSIKGFGQQSVGASLQGAYGFAMSPTSVLSLGFTYSLADISAGEVSAGGVSGKFKGKNVYSVYLEPGFNISPSTLGYFKVSYEAASLNSEGGGVSESKSTDGVGFGVGLRTLLTKNAYFQVEARQVTYNKVTLSGPVDVKGGATYGTIGIGYKF